MQLIIINFTIFIVEIIIGIYAESTGPLCLLAPNSKSNNGYRYYKDAALNPLFFIQMTKELGFTLSEIKELLEIQITEKGKCSLAQEKIEDKVTDVDKKIKDLKTVKKALKNTLKKCNEATDSDSCHFLDILGGLKSER